VSVTSVADSQSAIASRLTPGECVMLKVVQVRFR
jgi:hypothetical protein